MSNHDPLSDQVENRPDRLPPIRILDILILTSVMAMLFAFQDWMSQFGWFQSPQNRGFKFASSMVFAIEGGLALVSIHWLIAQKRITGRFMLQPGHWILFAYAVDFLIILAVSASYAISHLKIQNIPPWQFLLLGCVHQFSTATILTIAVFKIQLRWRAVLFVRALECIFIVFSYIYFSLMLHYSWPWEWLNVIQWGVAAAQVSCVVFLLVTVICDCVRQQRRDWLHWTGVFLLAVSVTVQPMLRFIYTQYFKPVIDLLD